MPCPAGFADSLVGIADDTGSSAELLLAPARNKEKGAGVLASPLADLWIALAF